MQIDAEEGYERPEEDGRNAIQNIAGDVPGHEVSVGGGDHHTDGQIDHPEETNSASARFATSERLRSGVLMLAMMIIQII